MPFSGQPTHSKITIIVIYTTIDYRLIHSFIQKYKTKQQKNEEEKKKKEKKKQSYS